MKMTTVQLLMITLLAFAGPASAFRMYEYSQGFGDTAYAVDINDRGVIVWAGFGDSFDGGASLVGGLGGLVTGYGYLGCSVCGVAVDDINNAGDMFGQAIKNGVWVPTIWLGGVPYDLTDPANAGLTFNFDPGPKQGILDLSKLDVVNLPDYLSGPDADYSMLAFTNARGDFVFEFFNLQYPTWGILTNISVPEPGTLALLGLGLAGLVASRRRKLD